MRPPPQPCLEAPAKGIIFDLLPPHGGAFPTGRPEPNRVEKKTRGDQSDAWESGLQ